MGIILRVTIVAFSAFNFALGQVEERGTIFSLIERGDHKHGMRVGVWEYYDHPRALSLKVDYDQGKLLYIQPDTSDFYVREGGQWVKSKLTVPCRFNGSITSLIDYYDQFSISKELFKEKKYFSSLLTFLVGPGGVATNPEVFNDPGYGVRDSLLSLFKRAPNSWITGIDPAGKAVTCRMAIQFDFCETCDTKTDFPAKVLFTGNNPRPGGPRSGDFTPLSFSPDNSKLFVMPSQLGGPRRNTSKERALIIDVKSKEIQQLPLDHYSGMWWLDNDNVLFEPTYYFRVPVVLAMLELSTNKVTFMSDAITYSHLPSADRTKVAFRSSREGQEVLSFVNLETGRHKTLMSSAKGINPRMWSPDGKYIAVDQDKEEFQKTLLIDVESGAIRQLPKLDARVCGWSSDSNIIYQYKITRNASETAFLPFTEVFETNLTSNLPQLLLKKRTMMTASYSAARNMFLLVTEDDAYLAGSDPDAKPIKIIEKCRAAYWSNDGEHIAYISTRDQQLHLYKVATKQSQFLTKSP